jgi:hypothetical protein
MRNGKGNTNAVSNPYSENRISGETRKIAADEFVVEQDEVIASSASG